MHVACDALLEARAGDGRMTMDVMSEQVQIVIDLMGATEDTDQLGCAQASATHLATAMLSDDDDLL